MRRGLRKKGDARGADKRGFHLPPHPLPRADTLLGTLAGDRDVLAQLHPPQRTFLCDHWAWGTASLGTSWCTTEDKGVPFHPSLPHRLACQQLPGIAPHLPSLQAVGHRGTISHRTVTFHVRGQFCRATADYAFHFCFKSLIK